MRPLILAPLLVGLAACGLGSGSAPDPTVIAVRVLDDRGAPVNRAEVTVTMSGTARVDAKTRSDGITVIDVADVGTYRVTVIPRDGYVAGSDPLTKQVTVDANEKSLVTFTLYRVSYYPPVEH